MAKFGLLGKTLKHSFSPQIHKLLGGYEYDLIEKEQVELESFVKSGEYTGLNVTIPYKKEIIKYLDVVDDCAKKIGAVNTVIKQNGTLYGYNTDWYGMEYALKSAGIDLFGKKVLILGSGGTSNTATFVAHHLGAKQVLIVSRNGEINYQNCYLQTDAQVIINTTPVGMYPNNYEVPLDLSKFENLEGVFDAVYNPNMTYLTFLANKKGVKYSNGLTMLVAQAKMASELFTNTKIDDTLIDNAVKNIKTQTGNIVLIGMAGVGKSTIAKELSKRLQKPVIDTDQLIEQREGKKISQIFAQYGEEYFRKVESQVLMDVGKQNGNIIATGGGVVERDENKFYIKQNAIVVNLVRDLEKLDRKNRPLSTDLDAVKKLFIRRKDKYLDFSDFTIDNNYDLQITIEKIMEKL